MKKYKVVKGCVILGFLTPQDQCDVMLTPEDNFTIILDNNTIWIEKEHERWESITTCNAIDIWEKNRILESI